jgi:DNA-binding CsgD family transcriptional regulator
MPAPRWQVERLVDDVAALGARGLPREEYFGEVAARLRRVVDCDATCWHTIDPELGLMTSEAPAELLDSGLLTPETLPAAGAGIVASEYLVDDFNTFASLARRRSPVGILSDATRGRPERSTRYRDVLAPGGIPFELRVAFVSRGRCWGAAHIARRDDRRDFTADEAEAVAAIAGTVAEGIRTSLRFDAARRAQPAGGPGLVVLDANNDVEVVTPPARQLLAAIRGSATSSEDAPPGGVLALAAFARTRGAHGSSAVAVPSAGGWITLHASLPDGGAEGRVAIVLEKAATPEATAVRLETHGVTPREREIARLLAQGQSNVQIATALVLSRRTVESHVSNIMGKLGFTARTQVAAWAASRDLMEDHNGTEDP